jgi:hypothetical protein
MCDEIRADLFKALEDAPAFLIHISYVDADNNVVKTNYNYFMDPQDLAAVRDDVVAFLHANMFGNRNDPNVSPEALAKRLAAEASVGVRHENPPGS